MDATNEIAADPVPALPIEVLFNIFSYLDVHSLVRASQVSKTWFSVANDPYAWKNVLIEKRVHCKVIGHLWRKFFRFRGVKSIDTVVPKDLYQKPQIFGFRDMEELEVIKITVTDLDSDFIDFFRGCLRGSHVRRLKIAVFSRSLLPFVFRSEMRHPPFPRLVHQLFRTGKYLETVEFKRYNPGPEIAQAASEVVWFDRSGGRHVGYLFVTSSFAPPLTFLSLTSIPWS